MKKGIYLTVEQKRQLALSGKNVPVCVSKDNEKISFIAKIRGSIFDGNLKEKTLRI